MPKKGDRTGPALPGVVRRRREAVDRAWSRVIRREGKGIARELIEDPVYLEQMRRRMRQGRLHPQIQVMLWGYGYGKPKELIEVEKKVAVRIIHEYAAGAAEPVGVGPEPEVPDVVVVPERVE